MTMHRTPEKRPPDPGPSRQRPAQIALFSDRCDACAEKDARIRALESEVARLSRRETAAHRRSAETKARDLELFRERLVRYPRIWTEIERRLVAMWREGRRHYSTKAVFEQLRYHWSRGEVAPDDRGFKFANNHTALFARMFCDLHPDMKDLFTLHESKFDGERPWEGAVPRGGTP